MTATLYDLDLMSTLTDEQRRAAGRLALAAAAETFDANGDTKDRGTKYNRIAAFKFFTDHYGDQQCPSFEDRLLAAGFLL